MNNNITNTVIFLKQSTRDPLPKDTFRTTPVASQGI
jgi:hypothetical protein